MDRTVLKLCFQQAAHQELVRWTPYICLLAAWQSRVVHLNLSLVWLLVPQLLVAVVGLVLPNGKPIADKVLELVVEVADELVVLSWQLKLDAANEVLQIRQAQ